MIQEKIIVGQGTKYPLNGCLTMPDQADGLVPAVVLVHGSGASNMDEKVGKLTPFKDLAEGLVKHGIASVRYDKRSFAHGFKMLRDKSTVITVKEEYINVPIPVADIIYVEAMNNYCRIFREGNICTQTRATLKSLIDMLPQTDFLRIHRSFVVAKDRVLSFTKKEVCLSSGKTLPVGRQYADNILL